MTAACATLDHTAYAIKLRCAEGLRAASTRKTQSVAYMVQNIGAVVPAVGRSPARKEVTSGIDIGDDRQDTPHHQHDPQRSFSLRRHGHGSPPEVDALALLPLPCKRSSRTR